MPNLLRVSDIQKGVNFPFTKSWAYKAKHLNRFPGLLVKVGSALFVDLDAFSKLAERGRLK